MMHLKRFFGQYASRRFLPNQILSCFYMISYCKKKLGTQADPRAEGPPKLFIPILLSFEEKWPKGEGIIRVSD
eukprot:UN25818